MKRIAIISVIAVVSVIGIVFFVGSPGQMITQPIAYDHKLHIEDAGFECLDCHTQAAEQARAVIPNIELCQDCHADAEPETAELVKVAGYISKGTPIPWIAVHRVPDHAYFSHRRHVAIAELECRTCHGDVESRVEPFTQPHVEITMEWCMDCHREKGVTEDCYACHR